jgi:hypothetical protein
VVVIVVALILTTLPFIFAYASAPPDRYFSGVMFNIPDHNQYFAWMRDLTHANLAPNRLTAEPNKPALFHLLWWTVGRVGGLFGLDYAATFGALRVLAVIILLATSYAFLCIAVPTMAQRRIAFLLFTFAGGIGFVWVIVKYLLKLPGATFPFDLYTSEPNSFFILLAFPHFGVALALVIGVIGLTLYAQQRQQLRYALVAGLVGALIGLQHAYDLLTVYTILGVWGLLIWWRDRKFPLLLGKSALIIGACTIPPAAYLSYLVLTDATWGGKLAQFGNAGAWTPNPLHLPILLGVPLILALLVFRPRMLKSRSDAEILIGTWFLAHFILAYLPLNFQIHLLLGWQVPLSILGAKALTEVVWPWLRTRTPRLAKPALAIVLVLCFATNIYIFVWRFVDLSRHAAPYYLSQNEVSALRWLGAHTSRDDVVLGTLEINQHVPVWSDARAFLAHWAGTLDYYHKVDLVQVVLNPATAESERLAILRKFGVTYLIVREQDSPRANLSAAAPALTPVFECGEVTIYALH